LDFALMMRKRYVPMSDGSVVDAETGEVNTAGFIAIHVPRQSSQFGQRFFMASQDATVTLAQRRHEFGMDGYAVLWYLLGRLDYENLIQMPQTEIAEALSMQPSHVSRAMKKLVDIGAIHKGPKVGGRAAYRLNPTLAWKGKPERHKDALKARMVAAKMSVVA